MPPPVDALHSTCKCYFVTWAHSGFCFFNPLTSMSDQDRIFSLQYVTLHGKTDTNAFPFKLLPKRLSGLFIRLKKFASV